MKGYVPAFWWKTSYFELRYEGLDQTQNIFIILKVRGYDMK